MWENRFVGKYHCECTLACLRRCINKFIKRLQCESQADFQELVDDVQVRNNLSPTCRFGHLMIDLAYIPSHGNIKEMLLLM